MGLLRNASIKGPNFVSRRQRQEEQMTSFARKVDASKNLANLPHF